MAEPTISQNLIPDNPEMADLLDLLKRDIMIQFACHHIGTIQQFNKTQQTAQVTINYKKTYFRRQTNGIYSPVLVDYPILLDCPVIFLGGGSTSLQMPVAAGDECIVLFNDRDMDNWFAGANGKAVATSRLHSLSDGVALVGIRSLAKLISSFDGLRALLTNGTVKLGINPSTNKVTLENGTGSLNTFLQDLLTQLQNLTSALSSLTVTGVQTGGGVSGPPVNASTITTIGTNIGNIATQIGGLLE